MCSIPMINVNSISRDVVDIISAFNYLQNKQSPHEIKDKIPKLFTPTAVFKGCDYINGNFYYIHRIYRTAKNSCYGKDVFEIVHRADDRFYDTEKYSHTTFNNLIFQYYSHPDAKQIVYMYIKQIKGPINDIDYSVNVTNYINNVKKSIMNSVPSWNNMNELGNNAAVAAWQKTRIDLIDEAKTNDWVTYDTSAALDDIEYTVFIQEFNKMMQYEINHSSYGLIKLTTLYEKISNDISYRKRHIASLYEDIEVETREHNKSIALRMSQVNNSIKIKDELTNKLNEVQQEIANTDVTL